MTRRYRATVAYDGTHCSGWQIQPGRRTVQDDLERAFETLTGARPRVHCSGRTDAGVHARRQVIHVDMARVLYPRKLRASLNGILKPDIRVLTIQKADPGFHARYDAVGKEYRYFIWDGAVLPPHLRFYRTHVTTRLDTVAMARAASLLTGRHDFAAFSANPHRETDGTVRRLDALRVRRKGHEVTLIAVGEGFLYKMVRSLAGFLIRVGRGDVEPGLAATILDSKVRTARVPTAPARGLFLWNVYY